VTKGVAIGQGLLFLTALDRLDIFPSVGGSNIDILATVTFYLAICLGMLLSDEHTMGQRTAMRRITTFRSTKDRIYDGGPIRL
jgi:hypothetical protein